MPDQPIPSVKVATDHVEQLEKDQQERVDKLEADKQTAIDRGYEKEVERIDKQIDTIKGSYSQAIEKAKVVVIMAVEAEKQNPNSPENRQKAIEDQAKNEARVAWIRAGGDPAQFEKSWESIRTEQLRTQVVGQTTHQNFQHRPVRTL